MKLQKLIAALTACGALSMSVNAQSAALPEEPIQACTLGEVTVPCEAKAWDIAFDVFYARQASETNWYTIHNPVISSSPMQQYQYHQHQPDWAWGFRAEASYHFGTGSDIRVNYFYLNRSTDNQLKSADNNLHSPYLPDWFDGRIPPIDEPIITPEGWNQIDQWSRTRLHNANIEFGQTSDFGEKINIRFHSGLGFIYLNHNLTIEGSNTGSQRRQQIRAKNEMQSRFSGIGPRFGQDTRYDFDNGVSIYGNYAIGAYIGHLKSTGNVTTQVPDDTRLTEVDIEVIRNTSSQTAMVAGFEARLGIQYALPVSFGDVTFDLAFHTRIYQNIIQQTGIENTVIGPTVISDIEFTKQNHNWGFFGPSLGIKVIGAI